MLPGNRTKQNGDKGGLKLNAFLKIHWAPSQIKAVEDYISFFLSLSLTHTYTQTLTARERERDRQTEEGRESREEEQSSKDHPTLKLATGYFSPPIGQDPCRQAGCGRLGLKRHFKNLS